MSQHSIEVKATVTVDGAVIMIAPVTLAFTNQLLMRLEGCELHATFGIDSCSMLNTPSDELGCLCLSLDNSLSLSLDAFYQFFGVAFPVGVTDSKNISISKDLFVLMVLKCITEPENTYRLNLHVEPPSVLSCGKPRISPEEGSAPTGGSQ
ncbi:TPA: hypothetical protein H2W49_003435 [Salmonella enterica]|nr:hypothetical protein [Salmonella enterica]HDP0194321.1 hypothetical protein [Salmonella enterica subsp. enterica serovar Concord]EFT5365376.1 hypothetical protein [Salmonella enterica]EME2407575.1 hypothetical protein [Salmonella enterica]HAK8383256.1 hypothetical protein [Salmonella enterica]